MSRILTALGALLLVASAALAGHKLTIQMTYIGNAGWQIEGGGKVHSRVFRGDAALRLSSRCSCKA